MRLFTMGKDDSLFWPSRLPLQRPKLPAPIYGNNEITCGNSYSSLWDITA